MTENENLFSETVEEEATAEIEEIAEDVGEEIEEAEYSVSSELEPAIQKKELSTVAKIAIQLVSTLVISVIVSVLTVSFAPKFKYDKAMGLIKKGKIQEAYDLLQEIDGSYKKAEEELKRFVIVPDEQTVSQPSYGKPASTSKIKTSVGKSNYKLEISQGEENQTQEVHYDAKGNVVKKVVSYSSGVTLTTVIEYDKNGNVIKETVTQSAQDQEPQVVSEEINKNMKIYYIGK